MILLCYDGSDSSKHVIDVAHTILGDAAVTVLHVWEPPASFLIPDTFTARGLATIPPEEVKSLDAAVHERAKRVLDEGVELAKRAGFDVEGLLRESLGSPWRTILEAGEEIDATLTVVGTHAVNAIEAALLGSISTAIVHHATRPVLVVPAVVSES
jgi:nucleotide-binding universal stress UspA family protein